MRRVRTAMQCMYASPPAFVACGYVVDHPAALAKTCARKKKAGHPRRRTCT